MLVNLIRGNKLYRCLKRLRNFKFYKINTYNTQYVFNNSRIEIYYILYINILVTLQYCLYFLHM